MTIITSVPIKFIYVNSSKDRRATVAYVYDDSIQAVRVAKAQCSKRDQFIKKVGREISSGRLTHHGGTVVKYETIGGSSYKQVAEYIRNNIDQL